MVLDPFMGTGAAAAAVTNGRHYVGYDISREGCQRAEKRIAEVQAALSQTTRRG